MITCAGTGVGKRFDISLTVDLAGKVVAAGVTLFV